MRLRFSSLFRRYSRTITAANRWISLPLALSVTLRTLSRTAILSRFFWPNGLRRVWSHGRVMTRKQRRRSSGRVRCVVRPSHVWLVCSLVTCRWSSAQRHEGQALSAPQRFPLVLTFFFSFYIPLSPLFTLLLWLTLFPPPLFSCCLVTLCQFLPLCFLLFLFF